jgi:hypothetical protein
MKFRVTDNRIAGNYLETESGTPVAELRCKHDMGDAGSINGASEKDVAGTNLIAGTRHPQCFSEQEG